MRFKNVSPFERYVDKAVLAVALGVLAFAGYRYVLSPPWQADGDSDPHAQLARTADRLQEKINGGADEVLTERDTPQYAARFQRRLLQTTTDSQLAVASLGGYRPAIGPGAEYSADQPSAANGDEFRELQIPTPEHVTVRADIGTLNPEAVMVDLDLREYINEATISEPYDIQWNAIAARLDTARLRENLTNQDLMNGRAIPQEWWMQTLALADFQIERQYLKSDGSWSQPQVIDPMPGQFSVRDQVVQISRSAADRLMTALPARQAEIARANMWPLINRMWQPPELPEPQIESASLTGQEGGPTITKEMLEQWEAQLDQRTRMLENAQRQAQRYSDAGRQPPARITRRIQELQAELQQLQQAVQQARQVLGQPDEPTRRRSTRRQPTFDPGMPPGGYPGEYGMPGGYPGMPGEFGMPGGYPGEFGMPGDYDRPSRQSPAELGQVNLVGGQDYVDMWTNDLDVESGRTYRYRVRVGVVNPLFFFKQRLSEAQAERIGDQFVVYSDWSDWSEPVETLRRHYFFLVGASSSVGRGTVEMWQFSDGQWNTAEFRVEPGDMIGQTVSSPEPLFTLPQQEPGRGTASILDLPGMGPEVDFSTEAYVVDFDFDNMIRSGLGIQPSPVMLYHRQGQILQRNVQQDQAHRQQTRQAILEADPQLREQVEIAQMQEEQQRRAELEQLRAEREADRARRASERGDRRSRDTRDRGGFDDPGGYPGEFPGGFPGMPY